MLSAVASPPGADALPSVGPTFTESVRPSEVRPGGAFLVDLVGSASAANASVGGRRFQFFVMYPGWLRVFAALPLEAEAGDFPILLDITGDDGSHRTVDLPVHVPAVEFPETQLKVRRRFVHVPKEGRARTRLDKIAIRRAYDVPFRPPRFEAMFASPRPGAEITSPFGQRRVFNGELESQHQGLDLNGRVGEPILVANAGTVRMARDCYTSGKTVIVDHGADVFTAYFHMSAMKVKPGQVVHRGQLIGLVGSTGNSTGPHTHFEVRVDNSPVDPMQMLPAVTS